MKNFDTYERATAWSSAADAFRDDLASGDRIHTASWGGLAILGYEELAALEARTPLAETLRSRLGDETAADLIAGMAFDAIDATSVGLDAALRTAFKHRDLLTPTAACVNECLRLASPTPMTMRMTTGEIRIGEIVIEAGTMLSMIWPAGNHDPMAFPEPERFDPDRRGPLPLSFGGGGHACLGHALVRTTLLELLKLLAERGFRLEGDPGPWGPLGEQYLPPVRLVV